MLIDALTFGLAMWVLAVVTLAFVQRRDHLIVGYTVMSSPILLGLLIFSFRRNRSRFTAGFMKWLYPAVLKLAIFAASYLCLWLLVTMLINF